MFRHQRSLVLYWMIVAMLLGQTVISHRVQAQSLGLEVKKTIFTRDSSTYTGYMTTLEFPLDNVKKEWWRYSKKFALLENRKSHYILSIPPKKGKSNTAVKYISVTGLTEKDSLSYLKLALIPGEMNPEERRKSRVQASEILIDFQIHFYSSFVQKDIVKKEKAAIRLSAQVDRETKRILSLKSKLKSSKSNQSKVRKEIKAAQKTKSTANTKLRSLQAQIDYIKRRLTEIK